MNQDELNQLFDHQAAGYDQQWSRRLAPINANLYFLLDAVFGGVRASARALCAGVGTGTELAHLARQFPQWRFTAVEPSGQMLALCRQRAENEGFADRCTFHEGYVNELPTDIAHDVATSFLVSQFILDRGQRVRFFRDIADRLAPGGLLASSDLSANITTTEGESMLHTWMTIMAGARVPAEGRERMRQAYARDVAILPPAEVTSILLEAGFDTAVPFFQAGLIHAWYAPTPALGSG